MTESTSEYKKRIEEIKQSIENEPYMAKMREDIAEGISKTGIRQATVEEQFQSVIDETTGKDVISAPEIILARGGEANLKARLDKEHQQVTTQLAQKANRNEVFSMENMGQDVKEAMTGGSVAVVGKGAVLKDNIVDKQVTGDKLSFSKPNINKFMGSYENSYIKGVGTLREGSDSQTAIIPIESGVTYNFKKQGGNSFFLAWQKTKPTFDESQEIALDYYVGPIRNGADITAPTDALYAIVTVSHLEGNPEVLLQVTKGEYPLFVGYDFIPLKHINNEGISEFIGDKKIKNRNLEDRSVSYAKQDFLEITTNNLFNGEFTDVWVQDSLQMNQVEGAYGYYVPLKDDSILLVKTYGTHNRFKLALTNSKVHGGQAGEILTSILSATNMAEIVTETKGYRYLFVGVSHLEDPPQLEVLDLKGEVKFKKEFMLHEGVANSKRSITLDNNWVWSETNVSVIRSIIPNSRTVVEMLGPSDRFAVYTFNNYDEPPTKVFTEQENHHSDGNIVHEFQNGDFKYIYILCNSTSGGYTPEIKVTQEVQIEQNNSNIEGDTAIPTAVFSTGIEKSKEIFPVLFGVKQSNERDIVNGYENESPRPIGWLYYHPETYDLYYASGTPDNMKFLCKWREEITWNESASPMWYKPYISPEGDIIFVWRGNLLGAGQTHTDSRQNPIIYPAGDYNNPIEVELTGEKPTASFASTGGDFIYSKDTLLIAEYTRPHHINAHIWKVTKPYTEPESWRTTKTLELSGNNHTGMKHYHAMNYDTYSGAVIMSTGDDADTAKIFMSKDFGETWEIVHENNYTECRTVNFVFDENGAYWAHDAGGHHLMSVGRDAEGFPDFASGVTLKTWSLPNSFATAILVKLDRPNGLLFLDEDHDSAIRPVVVRFYDFETEEMHDIGEFYPIGETYHGFTATASNIYQAKGDNRIVVGWDRNANNLDILGNTNGELKDRVNNIALEVIKKGEGYELKVTAINDRV